MASAAAPLRRPRDAAATRATIIECARIRFARENYDRVGLRDIATDAGIDAALVVRYFGSKEGLIEAVLADELHPAILIESDRATLGARIMAILVDEAGHARERDYFMLLLRVSMVPALVPKLQSLLEERLMLPFARWLGGNDAHVRAKLILTLLTGASLQTALVGYALLSREEAALFTRTLAGMLQTWVDG